MADEELTIVYDAFNAATADTGIDPIEDGADTPGPWTAAQGTLADYDDYDLESDYRWDSGLLQCPVAGPPGTPAVLIQVHAPYSKKIVRWSCQRKGEKPVLPSANTSNPNEVIATWACIPKAPALSLFANPVYRVSGIYEYYNILPLGTLSNLTPGTRGGIDTTPPVYYDVLPFQFDSTMTFSDVIPAGLPLPPGY